MPAPAAGAPRLGPVPRHNRPDSEAERPRSQCHSAHQRPSRVIDMLGETDRRRQSTGGSADAARMPPRGANTTAFAAPLCRSDQDAAAPDLGGARPGLCPEWPRARCARIFRMTAGSCSVAIRRRRPPQWAHAGTSMPNARINGFPTTVSCCPSVSAYRPAEGRQGFRRRQIQEQPVSCLTASAGRGEGCDSHPKGEKT